MPITATGVRPLPCSIQARNSVSDTVGAHGAVHAGEEILTDLADRDHFSIAQKRA
jgi:hypothetical protein